MSKEWNKEEVNSTAEEMANLNKKRRESLKNRRDDIKEYLNSLIIKLNRTRAERAKEAEKLKLELGKYDKDTDTFSLKIDSMDKLAAFESLGFKTIKYIDNIATIKLDFDNLEADFERERNLYIKQSEISYNEKTDKFSYDDTYVDMLLYEYEKKELYEFADEIKTTLNLLSEEKRATFINTEIPFIRYDYIYKKYELNIKEIKEELKEIKEYIQSMHEREEEE